MRSKEELRVKLDKVSPEYAYEYIQDVKDMHNLFHETYDNKAKIIYDKIIQRAPEGRNGTVELLKIAKSVYDEHYGLPADHKF